jgi:pimeloyl-ACP methyl ester carboxylesterase
MRYRREGAGRPLVVLRTASGAGAVWPELDAQLAARFRVITPEIPAGCTDVARWLVGFLEGLGIDRVVLVATDACCLAAIELVLLDAAQIDRLVLLPAGLVGESERRAGSSPYRSPARARSRSSRPHRVARPG